jgi:hypothetical protein
MLNIRKGRRRRLTKMFSRSMKKINMLGHIIRKKNTLFCLLEMHVLSSRFETIILIIIISNYILLMTLSICCRFIYIGNSMSFCLSFFVSNTYPNAKKILLKKKEEVIIYSLSYLLDGQQFFFLLSFFIGHLQICCCFSHAYIYIHIFNI